MRNKADTISTTKMSSTLVNILVPFTFHLIYIAVKSQHQ
jgi:hypothetical protein